jgi:hypothetical protein
VLADIERVSSSVGHRDEAEQLAAHRAVPRDVRVAPHHLHETGEVDVHVEEPSERLDRIALPRLAPMKRWFGRTRTLPRQCAVNDRSRGRPTTPMERR